mgnify:FL=1
MPRITPVLGILFWVKLMLDDARSASCAVAVAVDNVRHANSTYPLNFIIFDIMLIVFAKVAKKLIICK